MKEKRKEKKELVEYEALLFIGMMTGSDSHIKAVVQYSILYNTTQTICITHAIITANYHTRMSYRPPPHALG